MVDYFRLVSDELLNKLNQIKQFIKNHNSTIGILTEEILRTFLKDYLPKSVSVEQGFILSAKGEMSKQCDILIYDSTYYAPFYRINDIVVIPADSVIAVIEVKTTITKPIFHIVIDFFANISLITNARTYLFVYNSVDITNLLGFFNSYKHEGDSQKFDHDTFQLLPAEITGINKSYHLKKDYVVQERDMMGYSSFFYENEEGTEVSAMQNFYSSIYNLIEEYNDKNSVNGKPKTKRALYYGERKFSKYFAIELFDM